MFLFVNRGVVLTIKVRTNKVSLAYEMVLFAPFQQIGQQTFSVGGRCGKDDLKCTRQSHLLLRQFLDETTHAAAHQLCSPLGNSIGWLEVRHKGAQ